MNTAYYLVSVVYSLPINYLLNEHCIFRIMQRETTRKESEPSSLAKRQTLAVASLSLATCPEEPGPQQPVNDQKNKNNRGEGREREEKKRDA